MPNHQMGRGIVIEGLGWMEAKWWDGGGEGCLYCNIDFANQ